MFGIEFPRMKTRNKYQKEIYKNVFQNFWAQIWDSLTPLLKYITVSVPLLLQYCGCFLLILIIILTEVFKIWNGHSQPAFRAHAQWISTVTHIYLHLNDFTILLFRLFSQKTENCSKRRPEEYCSLARQ